MPKQFIPLTSEKSLLEETIARCSDPDIYASPVIICAQTHRFLIRKLLENTGQSDLSIIMEPAARNTAAAIAIAALSVDSEDVILVLPSDHFIPDYAAFDRDIQKGVALAAEDKIVTFGIQPTFPHTGYGYIEAASQIGEGFAVAAFHEKPDQARAQDYLQKGGFFWNAGIFMGKAKSFIAELQSHAPDIMEQTHKAWDARIEDLGDTLICPDNFAHVRSESFDYAVAEKTKHAVVVPTDFNWNDLGQWEALWEISDKDHNNNAKQGTIYEHDVNNAYLRSEDDIVLGVLGLDNIVAVAMKDAVFIAPKDRSQEIKHLVSEMKSSKQMQLTENPFTMRPWGSYEVMDEKPGFKVKKLIVNPGSKLSLQKHKHRSEHWVVVKGTATVTRNQEIFDVATNESVYLPCGAIHRLENKQNEQLEIIEVQTGDYLGEDDIIRIEDDYNRLNATTKAAS